MASKEHLTQAMANRIREQFDKAELTQYNNFFNKKTTVLSCKNTRTITLYMYIPTEGNTSGETFYAYDFINHTGMNDHYDLSGLAEKVLSIGYSNNDISGCTPDELSSMGFVPRFGTNLCAVSNMLMPDNYKLVTQSDEITYGQEYDTGHDGQPYYGAKYQDIFVTENLTIFDKVIAYRNVKIGTRCVNNYVGD